MNAGMRSRYWLASAVVAAVIVSTTRLYAQTSDRWADALRPGNYVRASYGVVAPINPEGSLRTWNRGHGVALGYENWDLGSRGGVSRIGVGIEGSYSTFGLDESAFLEDFVTSPNGRPLTATGNHATILQISLTTRLRIPMIFVMPNVALGLGFLDWRPGKVNYTTATGAGTVRQQRRSGALLTLSGGLDKHVVQRFAVFADASYTFAYTSFGSGLAASGSSCLQNNCDLLNNMQLGVVRGGMRVRVGR